MQEVPKIPENRRPGSRAISERKMCKLFPAFSCLADGWADGGWRIEQGRAEKS